MSPNEALVSTRLLLLLTFCRNLVLALSCYIREPARPSSHLYPQYIHIYTHARHASISRYIYTNIPTCNSNIHFLMQQYKRKNIVMRVLTQRHSQRQTCTPHNTHHIWTPRDTSHPHPHGTQPHQERLIHTTRTCGETHSAQSIHISDDAASLTLPQSKYPYATRSLIVAASFSSRCKLSLRQLAYPERGCGRGITLPGPSYLLPFFSTF